MPQRNTKASVIDRSSDNSGNLTLGSGKRRSDESHYSENAEKPAEKKKELPSFILWTTRRITLQCYICIGLNWEHDLSVATALSAYGGVFWLPYFFWIIAIGWPLITAEIALARYINAEIIKVWKMCPIAKGIFFNGFLVTCIIFAEGCVTLSYMIHFFQITSHVLKKNYSENNCWELEQNNSVNIEGKRYFMNSESTMTNFRNQESQDTAQELKKESWLVITYLAVISLILLLVNCRGITSLEKFSAIFVLIPYLCAVITLIMTLTLPGSLSHIKTSWKWKWSGLRDFRLWLITFEHIIQSFSIGTLCLTFISIHSHFSEDVMVDVLIVFLTDFSTTVIIALTTTGLLGHFADIIQLEFGLQFFSDYFTDILQMAERLGYASPKMVWSVVFYIYLVLTSLSYLSFMLASITDAVIAMFPKLKKNYFYVTCVLCILFYLIEIIPILIHLSRVPSMNASLLTMALLQSVTLFWIYSYQRVCTDFQFLMGYKPALFYQFCWVISPILVGFALVTRIYHQKTIDLLMYNTLTLPLLHVIIYVLCGVIELCLLHKKKQNYNIFKADESWGPSDPILRNSRLIFRSRRVTKEHIYRQNLYKKQTAKPFNIKDQAIVHLT